MQCLQTEIYKGCQVGVFPMRTVDGVVSLYRVVTVIDQSLGLHG